MRTAVNPPGSRRVRAMVGSAAAGAVAVSLLVTGCTKQDPPQSGATPQASQPLPTLSAPPGQLDAEEAFEKIKLDGVPGAPIHWQVSNPPEPDLAEAVLAARRYVALDHNRRSLENWNDEAFLYQYVATPGMATLVISAGKAVVPINTYPNRGPAWIWVIGFNRVDAKTVQVTACADITYWVPENEEIIHRIQLDALTVVSSPDAGRSPDGRVIQVQRWKVAAAFDNKDRAAIVAQYGTQCNTWAASHPRPPR